MAFSHHLHKPLEKLCDRLSEFVNVILFVTIFCFYVVSSRRC